MNLLRAEIEKMKNNISGLSQNRESLLSELLRNEEFLADQRTASYILSKELEMLYAKFPEYRSEFAETDFVDTSQKPVQNISIDTIRRKVTELGKNNCNIRSLMEEYGIEKLHQLDPEAYSTFYAKLCKI